MKFTLLFLAIFLSVTAWSQNVTFHDNSDKKGSLSLKKFNLKKLVTQIASYRSVDGALVGYDGSRTEQYERCKELSLNASEEELVQLTDHFSANVKAYAFKCLVGRKSNQVKAILEKHISDSQSFLFHSGCIVTHVSINNWFLDCASPLLTIKEEESYKLQIKSAEQ